MSQQEGLGLSHIQPGETKIKKSKKRQEDCVTTISLNLRGSKSRKAKNIQAGPSFLVDFRIHQPQTLGQINTAGLDQAAAIVSLAKAKDLDAIAITDYYSVKFAYQVKDKNTSSLKVFPGFMFRTKLAQCDDIQLCALFSFDAEPAQIEACIRSLTKSSQQVAESFVVEQELSHILESIEAAGGVCFPSNLDRTPNQMRCIPELVERYGFRTFDLAYNESKAMFKARWSRQVFNFFRFSGARTLAQAGNKAARLKLTELSWDNVKNLLKREV